jgi:hypothetical protein
MNDFHDKSTISARQQTLDHLYKYFKEVSDAKCLLWVDPAQTDPFDAVPLVEEHRIRVPIRHPRFDVQYGPYLVPLDLTDNAAADILEESVEKAWFAWTTDSLSAFRGQPIAGWIATQTSVQSLATYWARHCHLHKRQKMTKLLRFHDPGVREWLWPTLTEQQRWSLLGPADSILSIGRGHILQCHRRSSASFSNDAIPPLTLQEAQWIQVEDHATVHAVWVARLAGPDDRDDYTTGWHQRVFDALKAATHYGVKDAQDRELFALHALRLGCDFHTNEEMRPVWTKTLAGDYYGSALEDVFACSADQVHLHFKNC